MEVWLPILVIVAALASRPIEVGLWRRGRLSDRALALLLVGRFPVLVGLLSVMGGVPPSFTLLLIAVGILPCVIAYPLVRDAIREQSPYDPVAR